MYSWVKFYANFGISLISLRKPMIFHRTLQQKADVVQDYGPVNLLHVLNPSLPMLHLMQCASSEMTVNDGEHRGWVAKCR